MLSGARLAYCRKKLAGLKRRLFRIFFAPVKVLTKKFPPSVKYRLSQSRLFSFLVTQSRRNQRVYLKRGIEYRQFLDQLNSRGVEYVLLRWWENLPDYPSGEDLNILINDNHRESINDLVLNYDNGGRKCDVYTVSGVKNGSRKSLPVFSRNLTQALLDTRYLFNGAYVPSPLPYFASVAYHAVFHKGHNSGIPGFDLKPTKYVYDYTTALHKMADDLNLNVEVSLAGLYDWLKKEGFAPAVDTLSKYVEINPELSVLEKRLFSDARGGDLLVYVVRERLFLDGFLDDFTNFLKNQYLFDILDVRLLTAEEKMISTTQIRGGKWDNGPWMISGGPPVAFVVAYDYYPTPVKEMHRDKQTRQTNENNIKAKYDFRKQLNEHNDKNKGYNGVHSADNELDALYYISLLGSKYSDKITKAVEIRRQRYGGIWNVKKKLSAGANCKVEIIQYGEGLAVKKTFRCGKEELFEKELFASKVLSKELPFIPPLLEEGDGYLVIPYLENILESLSKKEKRRIIASKREEILGIMEEMHKRGLALMNFAPESLIITPEGKLYCTGFQWLQTYYYLSQDLVEAQETVSLSGGDTSVATEKIWCESPTFQQIWRPYLGSWNDLPLFK